MRSGSVEPSVIPSRVRKKKKKVIKSIRAMNAWMKETGPWSIEWQRQKILLDWTAGFVSESLHAHAVQRWGCRRPEIIFARLEHRQRAGMANAGEGLNLWQRESNAINRTCGRLGSSNSYDGISNPFPRHRCHFSVTSVTSVHADLGDPLVTCHSVLLPC